MTLEMKALGNSCNLACTYCYQEPMRKAGNVRASKGYDIELMMEIGDNRNKSMGLKDGYTMFGGEALLVPKKDLEIFFRESHKKYGRSTVQTNGYLIDDEHIEMFKKYSVGIGISFDGPNDLNSLRVPMRGDVQKHTEKTMDNIKKLVMNGVGVATIITLHKKNGIEEKLDRLINYLCWLRDMGVTHGNIHMMEVDSMQAAIYSMSSEENTKAFLKLAEFFDKPENRELSYAPFNEIPNILTDNYGTGCVWNSCDASNTQAVFGIEGNGQLSNCGMVNKEGIEWTKAEGPNSYARDVLLYDTPEEYGGCQGCPFFVSCNGYCPGSSLDGDWRNKTVHCNTLKALMGFYENKLIEQGIVPFSKREDRLEIEQEYLSHMRKGKKLPLSHLLNERKEELQ